MKKIIISGIILVSFILVGVFIFYPKYLEKKEMNYINSKVTMVNEYLLNNKGNQEEIKENLKKEETTKERLTLEKEVNKYLIDILDTIGSINNITGDEIVVDSLNIKYLERGIIDDNIKYLNEDNDKLNRLKEDLIRIKNKKFPLENEKIKFSEYEKRIDNTKEKISNILKVLDYLKKNNNWKIEEKLVFTKRNDYNEYQKLIDEGNISCDYELLSDTIGPVISASDITITKGTKVDIKSKIKCIDAVDDACECKIDGSFDVNKVGTYEIKITSVDQSNNTSLKKIKLIVKEKSITSNSSKTSKKPYYIEVIRNHNVVIVYGLDSENKYTKIVKVFACSVGLNGKTPTGTFTTSDKASWGWLVGNVYGQYYTRITGSILFHSVPYFKKAKNQLEWEEYNKLGTAASKGCVRLTVRDVKWIYDNCPRGTTVKIYDGSLPSGVTKPSVPKIDKNSPNKGWDPTDPDKNNPWKK